MSVNIQRLKDLLWGHPLMEQAGRGILRKVYQAQFQNAWTHSAEAPHFYCHRWNAFKLLDARGGPEWMLRGLYAFETIRPGDRVLDIGCGDGFLTRTFLAARASHVDAIDIEPSAIAEATTRQDAPNIVFRLMDAALEPFPHAAYQVIVWDGAIGHFSRDDAGKVLNKISRALVPDGIFVGSESLGQEGHDHLQFFDSLESLAGLLLKSFRHVYVRQHEYCLPGGVIRREAYWRCSDDLSRLNLSGWQIFAGPGG